MAAGLTDEPWSWQRILTYPLYRPEAVVKKPKRQRRKKKK